MSCYEKLLPANVHIFYDRRKMINVKKHKSFSGYQFQTKQRWRHAFFSKNKPINCSIVL